MRLRAFKCVVCLGMCVSSWLWPLCVQACVCVCLSESHSGRAVSSWQAHLQHHPVWHTAGPDVFVRVWVGGDAGGGLTSRPIH